MPSFNCEVIRSTSQNENGWGVKVASYLVEAIRRSLARSGRCSLALSGGSSPARVYEALAELDLPWQNIHIWQTDERVVANDDDRAWRTINEFLVTRCDLPSENLHPFVLEGSTPEQIAAYYAEELQAELGHDVLDVERANRAARWRAFPSRERNRRGDAARPLVPRPVAQQGC